MKLENEKELLMFELFKGRLCDYFLKEKFHLFKHPNL